MIVVFSVTPGSENSTSANPNLGGNHVHCARLRANLVSWVSAKKICCFHHSVDSVLFWSFCYLAFIPINSIPFCSIPCFTATCYVDGCGTNAALDTQEIGFKFHHKGQTQPDLACSEIQVRM